LIPISDCHTHTNPVNGLGMKSVAKRFREVGGWFIAIVSLPPSHYGYPPTVEGYQKSFEIVIREADIAREYGLKVSKFVGMHPADVEKNLSRLGPEKTLDLVEQVFKIIEKMLREGVVDGLGEFGRPHYKALPEAFAINEYVTIRALELSRDLGVPIHLHLEQKGLITIISINKVCKALNAPQKNVIIHHADSRTAVEASKVGFPFTLLAKFELVSRVLSNENATQFALLESDHIDDPRRPGVALYPWEIRDCVNALIRNGVHDEVLYKVLIDNVVKTFGVNPP